MREWITIRIVSSDVTTLTYRPDREFYGDKSLEEIAKADIEAIKKYDIDPDDLHLMYSESETKYHAELIDYDVEEPCTFCGEHCNGNC